MVSHKYSEEIVLNEPKKRKKARFTNKQVCDYFFTPLKDLTGVPTGRYLCRCNGNFSKSGSGYTNLMNHVKSSHSDYEMIMLKEVPAMTGTLLQFVEDKAMNMCKWIEWLVMCDLPYSFVDCEYSRKNTLLKSVSSRSVAAVVVALTAEVEKSIAAYLPPKFGIVVDGWTHNSEHYFAVFASFRKKTVLLAFAPLVDDGRQDHTAKSHIEFLHTTLGYFNKTLLDVVYMVGDNCSVNKRLAEDAGFPMIGCASHRLNLATKAVFEPYADIIAKVHDVMVKLRTLNESAWLRQHTHLRPIVEQDTRWDSTYTMLKRYTKLAEILDRSPTLCDHLPHPHELRQIQRLVEDLVAVKDVSMYLQGTEASMDNTRVLFDGLIDRHAAFARYLSPSADIIKFKAFENACVKAGGMKELDRAERKVLAKLADSKAIPPPDRTVTITSMDKVKKRKTFVEQVLEKKAQPVAPQQKYSLAADAPPTSNVVERLFSSAKHVVGERRHRLKPQSFESLLFLKANHEHWTVADVAAAMKAVSAQAAAKLQAKRVAAVDAEEIGEV